MGIRRGESSLGCPYHYTDEKNKFVRSISCLQTYYTREYRHAGQKGHAYRDIKIQSDYHVYISNAPVYCS